MRRSLYILASAAGLVCFGAAIFWVAGNWHLPFFWAVLGLYLAASVVGIIILDPDLVSERIRPGGKDADPWGPPILTFLCLVHYVIAAIDVGRLHISDNLPLVLQAPALVLCALGWVGLLWSMRVNRYFSSAIRLQKDRGQYVIKGGPYRWIRHPGYAFASLAFLCEGAALGSWLSVIPAIFIVIDLAYRTNLEERLLREELPGYTEYTQQVRFRWLPGVW